MDVYVDFRQYLIIRCKEHYANNRMKFVIKAIGQVYSKEFNGSVIHKGRKKLIEVCRTISKDSHVSGKKLRKLCRTDHNIIIGNFYHMSFDTDIILQAIITLASENKELMKKILDIDFSDGKRYHFYRETFLNNYYDNLVLCDNNKAFLKDKKATALCQRLYKITDQF